MKVSKETSVRLTIALTNEQANRLSNLCNNLDIDQGKAIRWMMDTCIELMNLSGKKPEFRKGLCPRTKYLLDTLSEIDS